MCVRLHPRVCTSQAAGAASHGLVVCGVDGCSARSHSSERMCNEPCSASVTFGLIDYKQRPFNMQACSFLTMQHSFLDEITNMAWVKTPSFSSTACCVLNWSCAVILCPASHMGVTTHDDNQAKWWFFFLHNFPIFTFYFLLKSKLTFTF